MELKGSSVLITGASSGIGWETALAFGRAGCRVAAAARRTGKLEDLSRQLAGAGTESLALSCDVQRRGEVEEAVRRTTARFGRLDILVNNAGVLEMKAFAEHDPEAVERMMRTNFMGPVYAIHAALPIMRRQGEGHIINVASIAGLMGFPYMASYCASKFALVGLTDSLRRELRGTGITLTSFCPGSVDTPMVADILHDPGLSTPIDAKTPGQVAERIVRAARNRAPEIVFGEVPGALTHFMRLFPRLSDWAVRRGFDKMHPLGKREKTAEDAAS